MNYDQILSQLSQLSYVWTTDSNINELDSFQSLQTFVNHKSTSIKNYQADEVKNPGDISYHQSLLHFFLYYAYYPKIPFVIKTDEHLYFGSFHGKNYKKMELSMPIVSNYSSAIQQLEYILFHASFHSLLKKTNVSQIILRDIPDDLVRILRSSKQTFSFKLSSLHELYYQTYDVSKTLQKKGKQFANIRWHLNKFHKQNHAVKSVSLSDNLKAVIHLIGEWKHTAIEKRGFSYVNLRSDKQAARLFAAYNYKDFKQNQFFNQITPSDCLWQVLLINGQIRSFNFGYPLGIYSKKNVFAHAIGIADISIPHLAEYAQYAFWKKIHQNGYSFVNDGPSWKNSLEIYKQKFRPIDKKRYYYATLKI
ncbi:MAG: hypothetical protein KGY50_00360 [Candidatus Thermoplasmatota archaeon]|nr:hypothetical protein [Candidatus Thermoplasmatota archaeon]